jgi:hypothetical protein
LEISDKKNKIMQRKSMKKFILLLIVWAVAAGCSRVQVSQDYDLGMDFYKYQFFSWRSTEAKESSDIRINNPLLQKRIVTAINQSLSEMGYISDDLRPDFLVDYDVSISTKIESYPFTTSYGYGFGAYRDFGGGLLITSPEINQYDVGMLVIDIYDKETNQLVWRGTGSEIVTTHSTPEQTTELVQRMVHAILSQFPPD